MDTETDMPQNLPCGLPDDIGKIVKAEPECPGVWYAVIETDGFPAAEYYIVARDADGVSDEAKAYGKPLPHHPKLLAYSLDDPRSGAGILRYEILRRRVQNRLPLPEGETLLSAAVFGMENYPDYFGSWPAPRMTPRGFTTRWRERRPGVFTIETDRGETLLAVCCPLWTSCLPEPIRRLAEQTDFDRAHGIGSTLGYLFFPEAAAHLVLAALPNENTEDAYG